MAVGPLSASKTIESFPCSFKKMVYEYVTQTVLTRQIYFISFMAMPRPWPSSVSHEEQAMP